LEADSVARFVAAPAGADATTPIAVNVSATTIVTRDLAESMQTLPGCSAELRL
jgi:hypothetical protein